jgi:hypothetical protein
MSGHLKSKKAIMVMHITENKEAVDRLEVVIDWTQKEVLILAFDYHSSFTE